MIYCNSWPTLVRHEKAKNKSFVRRMEMSQLLLCKHVFFCKLDEVNQQYEVPKHKLKPVSQLTLGFWTLRSRGARDSFFPLFFSAIVIKYNDSRAFHPAETLFPFFRASDWAPQKSTIQWLELSFHQLSIIWEAFVHHYSENESKSQILSFIPFIHPSIAARRVKNGKKNMKIA